MQTLVQDLPPNSPLRGPLLAALSKGLSLQVSNFTLVSLTLQKEITSVFGLSEITVRRACAESEEFLYELLYHPSTTRQRVNNNQIEFAKNFIDEALPTISGRNYKILETSEDHLYEMYCAETDEPVSKTFFIYKVLHQFNYHHSFIPPSCVYCAGAAPTSRKGSGEALEWHKVIAHTQRSQYLKEKAHITATPGALLIVQDFTKIDFANSNCQDLIITIYFHDESEPDNIGHSFHHFLSDAKNDINFVTSVWEEFLPEIIKDYNPIEISLWSDGARKHFRTVRHLSWWWEKVITVNLQLTYHFFESYHGHSVCDGAATHVKVATIRYQQQSQSIITTLDTLNDVINDISNHISEVAKVKKRFTIGLPTKQFKDFSKGHKFQFNANGKIYAFLSSASEQNFACYTVKAVI